MANIYSENEVSLNSQTYTINGKVTRTDVNQFPSKLVLGDTTYDDEPVMSNWIISDQRGGIGKEFASPKDLTRCWWSTGDLDHEGHLLPQPLASALTLTRPTITDGGLENWTTDTNLTSWTETLYKAVGSDCVIAKEATQIHGGTYAARLDATTASNVGSYAQIAQTFTGWNNAMRGGVVRVNVWCNCVNGTAAAQYDLTISDGTDSTEANPTVNGSYAKATIVHTINAAATGLTLTIRTTYNAGTEMMYVDDIDWDVTADVNFCYANWNQGTYISKGSELYKISSSDGVPYIWKQLPKTITSLTATVGTTLAIGQGDDNVYYYLTSAGVLTVTDKTGCYFGIHWNDLFCYVNTAGQFTSIPALAASPTETDKGKIGDGSTINRLCIYQDTSLDDQVYCGTSILTWVHDWTNGKWVASNIKYAAHPNAGKGMVNWNTGLYISMGIHVKKYSITGGTASTESVGLDKDDGLPIKVASTGTNYFGEITYFIDDNECFYACYDSTQYGSNGYSWLGKCNGYGWQVLWATTTLNQAMYGGIVGTVYTRRLYFDCGGTLYAIPLLRVKVLPKRVSTYTYAASAIHVTPWFTGGSWTKDKLIKAAQTFCASLTTTETVTVSYRTNRTNTDLDTGWTELVVLNSTGENGSVDTALASGVGVSCNLIQFKFALARGDTTTTAPDLQSFAVSYQKWLSIKGMWSFNVVAEKGKQTPHQIETNLLAARASVTLVPFIYRDGSASSDTKYVRVLPFKQKTPTGLNYDAEYEVTVIEL